MARVLIIDYMCEDVVCTHIEADYNTDIVTVTNFTDDVMEQAIGKRKASIDIIDTFFRERCFPETRFNKKELLESAGLQFFDAEAIVRQTHGVLIEDNFWVRFEGETLTWNDVKLSNR